MASKPFILVLDEIDVLFHDRRGNPSDFIYGLLMIEEELRNKGHSMCIIAISDRVALEFDFDERVKSRLGHAEIFFPAYSKQELFEILSDRAAQAFSIPVDRTVLEYCAELCSRDHGDARRAIDVIKRAAETSSLRHAETMMRMMSLQDQGQEQEQERDDDSDKEHGPRFLGISTDDVDAANSGLQRDRISIAMSNLPDMLRIALTTLVRISYLTEEQWYSTSVLLGQYELLRKEILKDGQVVEGLVEIDSKEFRSSQFPRISRRRFSELLAQLGNAGLIVAQTKSDGRHGYKTRYMLTDDPAELGPSCYGWAWWDSLVELKAKREDFMSGNLFQKVFRDFKKKTRDDDPSETIFTEMNDYNWNYKVYGKFTGQK